MEKIIYLTNESSDILDSYIEEIEENILEGEDFWEKVNIDTKPSE